MSQYTEMTPELLALLTPGQQESWERCQNETTHISWQLAESRLATSEECRNLQHTVIVDLRAELDRTKAELAKYQQHEQRYKQRLQELAVLQKGWDSYTSLPPTKEALLAAETLLRSFGTIVPCVNGGVQIDWPNGEITFLPDGTQEFDDNAKLAAVTQERDRLREALKAASYELGMVGHGAPGNQRWMSHDPSIRQRCLNAAAAANTTLAAPPEPKPEAPKCGAARAV